MPQKSKNRRQSKKKFKMPNINLLAGMGLLLLSLGFILYQTQQSQNYRGHAQTVTNCQVTADQQALNSEEQKLLQLINDYRATKGKQPFTILEPLNRSAAWLSIDNNTRGGTAQHDDSLGRSIDRRFPDCGFVLTGQASENIADSAPTAQSVFDQWVKAQDYHTDAILNNDCTGIGNEGSYWTMDFSQMCNTTTPLPSGGVPSPQCIGSCPTLPVPTEIPTAAPTAIETIIPSQIIPTQDPNIPTPTFDPNISLTPVLSPLPTQVPGQIGIPGGGIPGGIIGIIIGVIIFFLLIFLLLRGIG